MSMLSDWAKKQRKTDLPYLMIKEGMDIMVEFDETAPPRMNTTDKGEYANYRVSANGAEYNYGVRKDTNQYNKITKYLAAEIYLLRFRYDSAGLHIDPAGQ